MRKRTGSRQCRPVAVTVAGYYKTFELFNLSGLSKRKAKKTLKRFQDFEENQQFDEITCLETFTKRTLIDAKITAEVDYCLPGFLGDTVVGLMI